MKFFDSIQTLADMQMQCMMPGYYTHSIEKRYKR